MKAIKRFSYTALGTDAARAFDSVQNGVDSVANTLRNCPLADGSLVGIDLSNVDRLVPHGLDRIPLGYIVVRRSAAFNVFDSPAPAKSPEKYINLRAEGSMHVSLWIF